MKVSVGMLTPRRWRFGIVKGAAALHLRSHSSREREGELAHRLKSLSAIMASTRLPHFIRSPPQLPTPILVVSKLVLSIIPIVEIIIGAVYLNDCPRQHYIPIYLIVGGVFAILLALLACLPCSNEGERPEGSSNPLRRICRTWNTLTSIFLLAWFITGSVWIYSIYQPNYNKNATDANSYCDKTLYLFAFWVTTIVYILMAVSLVISICSLIFSHLCGRANTNDNV